MKEKNNVYRASSYNEGYIVDSGDEGTANKKNENKSVLTKIIISIVLTAIGCLLIPIKNIFPAIPLNYLIFLFAGFVLCDIALGLAIRAYLQIINRETKEDDGYNTDLEVMRKSALIWLLCSIVITLAVTFIFAYLVGKNGMTSLFGK